jgi:signal transduction histidine kinase
MKRIRTLRGRLTALATLAAFFAIAILVAAFNLVLSNSLGADADSRLRSQAAAAGTTVTFDAGRLRLRESPDDAALDRQVWVYQGTRAVERPRGDRQLQQAADALAGRARAFANVDGDDVRLYADPVTRQGRQVGTVVVGESLAAYDRTTDLALIGSLALASVLLAGVFALTWLVVGRALDPVREMTRSAADWSEHDPARRFGSKQQRPDELGDLAQTFDQLLDRVAASLRHEQRLSAELSHELRTPLARIVAEIELLQRRERPPDQQRDAHAAIARSAEQMSRILETLMAAARADAGLDQGRSDPRATLRRLAGEWQQTLADAQLELSVDLGAVEAPLVVGMDSDVIERIAAPLIDNARRYARSRVELSLRRRGSRTEIAVSDDGPGVPADLRESLFEPGSKDRDRDGHGGAGLGLALARRLARAAGGDVAFEPAAAGPTFVIDLPS